VNRPRWARWLVLAAGPGFNYAMAAVLFIAYAAFWPSPLEGRSVIEVGAVAPGMPAEAAGLHPGDLVVDVDGAPSTGISEFKAAIAGKAGAAVTLNVLRDGQPMSLTLTPKPVGSDFQIGVSPSVRFPRVGVVDTLMIGVKGCALYSEQTLKAFAALAKREPGVSVQGPVKIVADMKEQIAKGGRYFLFIMAILSVNLGLFNLLPVPSLDGIKMLFLTVEGIVRRDLNAAMQVWVNAIGLLALLGLMALLMVKETFQLFS
jgi:regulator of sigma E protease